MNHLLLMRDALPMFLSYSSRQLMAGQSVPRGALSASARTNWAAPVRRNSRGSDRCGTIGHTAPGPAQRVLSQNSACAKFRGNRAYRPNIGGDLPAACNRGRRNRYTEGFRGGWDCQLLIAG